MYIVTKYICHILSTILPNQNQEGHLLPARKIGRVFWLMGNTDAGNGFRKSPNPLAH